MGHYPVDAVHDVVLSGGKPAHVRPIRPDDAEMLSEGFASLSPASRYARFHQSKGDLSDTEVAYLTRVDYVDHMALIALVDGGLAGVGRYVRLPEDASAAELAFTVGDCFRGEGIAPVLLEDLSALAPGAGVQRFVANVLYDNRAMMKVFHKSGRIVASRVDHGIIEIELRPGSAHVASQPAPARLAS